VDIPQEGDVNKMWKTEATRALPVAGRANERGTQKEAESVRHNDSLVGN
jgi:hypothetical protein